MTTTSSIVTFAMVIEALAAPQFSNGLLWMSRAMSGEQGGVWSGNLWDQAEVGKWIGHTVLNRVRDPRWSGSVEEVVRGGFYGHAKAQDHPHLTTRMYKLAGRVVLHNAVFGQDVTDGCYWMYSFHDLEKMDPDYKVKAARCFGGSWTGGYGLCFFREPPSG